MCEPDAAQAPPCESDLAARATTTCHHAHIRFAFGGICAAVSQPRDSRLGLGAISRGDTCNSEVFVGACRSYYVEWWCISAHADPLGGFTNVQSTTIAAYEETAVCLTASRRILASCLCTSHQAEP